MKRIPEGLIYFKKIKKERVEEYWRFDSYEEYLDTLREFFSPRAMAEDYVEDYCDFPRFIQDKIIEEVTPAFADVPVEKIADIMVRKVTFQLVYNSPKDLAEDFGLGNILDEIEVVGGFDGFRFEYVEFVTGMNEECPLVIPVVMSLEDYYSQKKSWKTAYCGGKVDVVTGRGYCFSIPAYEISAENAEIDWKDPLIRPSILSFEECIFSKATSVELRALIEIEIARVKKGGK